MAGVNPIALGYLVETFLMTPAERDQAIRQLITFAESNGYDMPQVFVEELPTAPAAFVALLAAISRTGPAAVVGFGASALPPHRRAELDAADVKVMVADPSP